VCCTQTCVNTVRTLLLNSLIPSYLLISPPSHRKETHTKTEGITFEVCTTNIFESKNSVKGRLLYQVLYKKGVWGIINSCQWTRPKIILRYILRYNSGTWIFKCRGGALLASLFFLGGEIGRIYTHMKILTLQSTHLIFLLQNITLYTWKFWHSTITPFCFAGRISHFTFWLVKHHTWRFLALICASFYQKSLNWHTPII
jgi:hypothetical protein